MSKHECQRCGESKTAAEMVVRGGKPSRTCITCFRASFGARSKKGERKARAPKPVITVDLNAEEAPAVEQPARLIIEPGHGIDTWVENDMVQVAQGDSVHAYTRSEWKVMHAHHAEWAGLEVTP